MNRAFDNQCWLVSSDVVWNKNDDQVCPGYATILDDNGQIVAQAQAFQEMLLIYAIPMALLTGATAFKKGRRQGVLRDGTLALYALLRAVLTTAHHRLLDRKFCSLLISANESLAVDLKKPIIGLTKLNNRCLPTSTRCSASFN